LVEIGVWKGKTGVSVKKKKKKKENERMKK
jgi:hypothetical protein